MKRIGYLMASAALCGGLVISEPAQAFRGGFGGWGRGGMFTGRSVALGGWNRGFGLGGRNRWGWNRGWGWGGWWPAYAGLGVAAAYPWWGWDYPYYGYYGYDYLYGYYSASALAEAPLVSATAAVPPLMTGRSVATGHMGNYCTTAVTTCELRHASYVGGGCSCRVPGGRARGTVSP